MPSRPGPYYGSVAQLLHWATAILVLYAYCVRPGGSETSVYSAARDAERRLHETLGISVFALTALRLIWRGFEGRPDALAMPRWMHVASRLVQGLLFTLLFAIPLTAISGAWFEGHELTFLGGIQIPIYVSGSHDTGATLAELHGWLGDILIWTAGAHAVAALYHHFVLKDGVLGTMLPRFNRSGGASKGDGP
jgi:cytochrome b561